LTNGGFVLPDVGSVSVLLGNGDGTFQSHADYTAGIGPKVPLKIKFRDYLAYVLISLGVVRAVLLIALYEAQRHADFVNCRKIPITLKTPADGRTDGASLR
jgi:hypothetical protein